MRANSDLFPPPLLSLPPGWERKTGDGYSLAIPPAVDARGEFARSVADSLSRRPRHLLSTWLYDTAGSELFEQITHQPEYYQTRTENDLLARWAPGIREQTGPVTLVELGSGSSTKTRRLLEAILPRGPAGYVPIDVSRDALESACRSLAADFPALEIEGIASTYEQALPLTAHLSPVLLSFLGSTVGNIDDAAMQRFFGTLSDHLAAGDFLLLGIDLVKDRERLEAAYNDAAGVTAAFTINLFARINRELGCQIPLEALSHEAFYNAEAEQIEIYARFDRPVVIDLPQVGRSFAIAGGERVRTEISHKFRPEAMATRLSRHGFALEHTCTDADDLFAVQLFRRDATTARPVAPRPTA
ncbi:MAG: L-histidine N(alpha)-methyltransferase [Acidobacteriota bacterium]